MVVGLQQPRVLSKLSTTATILISKRSIRLTRIHIPVVHPSSSVQQTECGGEKRAAKKRSLFLATLKGAGSVAERARKETSGRVKKEAFGRLLPTVTV